MKLSYINTILFNKIQFFKMKTNAQTIKHNCDNGINIIAIME